MIEILRHSYNVVFVGIFVFFILLHKKRSNEERKREILKILVLVAVWTTFVVWLNVSPQGSTKVSAGAAATSERTFLSRIP